MFDTAIAGNLPMPTWLADTQKFWPQWKASGPERARAELDATLMGIKTQEVPGLGLIGDAEQSRQHVMHDLLQQVEGIDFEHPIETGMRNDHCKAMLPQGVAPSRLKRRVHEPEARLMRARTPRWIKLTLPGPLTLVDTVADRHDGDRKAPTMALAMLLNQEALERARPAGRGVIRA